MCWIGNINNKKVAEKPIEVFKVAKMRNGKYYAPFINNFEYEIGKTYHAELMICNPSYVKEIAAITKGLHSYSAYCTCERRKTYTYCTLVKGLSFNVDSAFLKCIIPTSSTYYENKFGEIVSDALEIICEVKGEWEETRFKDLIYDNKRR